MKTPVLCLAFAVSVGSILSAAEIAPGASLDEVRATLGAPRGQLRVGERHLLYYERGTVELQDGTLRRTALRTPEEQAILVAREERVRSEQEARRAELIAEGTALRESKLVDATFQAAPVAYQVSFWEEFARNYPGVSCKEPLTIARLRLGEQLEAKREREEAAARLAEREERYAAANRFQNYYPVRYYSSRYDRHHDYSVGLGPITYTFFDSPLPPYSTPSGNPAGNLTGTPINPASVNSAQSGWNDSNRSRWQQEDRPSRSRERGSDYRRSYDRT